MKFSKSAGIFLCLLLLASCVFQSPQRRAQRKMAKEKYAKAEKLLIRSLEKDSLNPAAHYLFSRLYLDTAYNQHIDTAQYFILQALEELPLADKKDRRRLRKIDADSASLVAQLSRVDSAAFERATDAHTIEAYNYFLDRYAEADQAAEAWRRRNALAFRAAEEENTYQSYQQFFQTYPEAAEAAEARERYEELLFIANTQTGTLDAYVRFLNAYPETPYRSRLLRNIYQLSTAAHQAEQYARFIRRYPANLHTREAVNQLYHLHKEHERPASFLQSYPQLPFRDSLQQVVALDEQALLAVLTEDKWQFINEAGAIVLAPQFDDVHPDYLCETVPADYVEAIRGMEPVVMAKNGSTILEEDYQQLEDLGYGLLRIRQNDQYGLLTKSGQQFLPAAYENISLLGDNLLRVKEYGRQGILTMNGQWLTEPTYDSLARLGNFILLFRNSKIAVSSTDTLIEALQTNTPLNHSFQYQEAVLADTAHLFVYTADGRQAVLNSRLQTVIPPASGKIRSYEGGWILEQDDGFHILDSQGEDILHTPFSEVMLREPWIAYKTDSLWGLYNTKLQEATFDVYDSLSILHQHIIVAHKGKQKIALFIGQDTVAEDLTATDSYRLLRPVTRTQSRQQEQVYLLVSDGNAKKVYHHSGRLIAQGRYTEVVAPDNQLLMLKSSRGTAIADTSGQILLKPAYQAVGNYQNGYFATLNKSRFGVFNPYKGLHIRPQYSVALRPYNDSLLLASKNKHRGIINHENKAVLPFEYDQLQFWTDSVVLAEQQGEWQFINIHQQETLYGPFRSYKLIKQAHDESLAIVYTSEGYGVYSSRLGELIAPTYDDIVNLGTADSPLFYCEKEVKEADLFVVVYVNASGETIFRQAYPRAEWLKLLCE